MRLDDEIDRLYQLPLAEFTSERNALAKRAGPEASAVKSLAKPPLAAWAVNQLHWQKRDVYDALIEAAETLRATHAAVMAGRRGDLRAAGREHDEAIERALKATLALLADAGHPGSDTNRQAIAQTLRALPAADPPGRLTRALQPGGFEALAGMTASGGRARSPARVLQTPKPAPKPPAARDERDDRKAREARKEAEQEEAALARAREESMAAARELRQAEQASRRAEFESARATRATEKVNQRVAAARAALEAARSEVEEADAEATRAERQEQAARREVDAAARDLTAARKRAAAADKQLERLSS